jgi:hypothetical protein
MGTVTINGKIFNTNGGRISVTPKGVFIDGVHQMEGVKDFDGKEAGKVVIVIPPNSACSLNIQNVDAVEIRGNLDGFQGKCGTLSVGNNMTSSADITTKNITVGNNLTSGDLSTETATIGGNCNCYAFIGCKPMVGGKIKII